MKDIDEILKGFESWCACGNKECVKTNNLKQAKQELLSTIKAGLPEKKKLVMDEKCAEHNKTNWEHTETYEVCSAHTQYNQAISEVEDKLNELFGVSDE